MAFYADIAIIGSGNVAWHLTRALEEAGHHIHEVYSRNTKNAQSLVSKLYSTNVAKSLDFSNSEATLFIIAVSDDAIEEVASDLIIPKNATVVHTSGSASIEILNGITNHYGVLYPFQSFSKSRKVNFKDVSILVEASDKETNKLLLRLGGTISDKVVPMDSAKRSALHISAVVASNFTNHLLLIAKQIATANKIDFELLEPLIIETVNKSLENGPEKSQTGPAARGDLKILDQHLSFLEGNAPVQEIYKLLSQHILDQKYYDK